MIGVTKSIAQCLLLNCIPWFSLLIIHSCKTAWFKIIWTYTFLILGERYDILIRNSSSYKQILIVFMVSAWLAPQVSSDGRLYFSLFSFSSFLLAKHGQWLKIMYWIFIILKFREPDLVSQNSMVSAYLWLAFEVPNWSLSKAASGCGLIGVYLFLRFNNSQRTVYGLKWNYI